MNPELGRQAAEEAWKNLKRLLKTATWFYYLRTWRRYRQRRGAGVAELAKNKGILTVGVVTKPFTFEGSKRKVAETAMTI